MKSSNIIKEYAAIIAAYERCNAFSLQKYNIVRKLVWK